MYGVLRFKENRDVDQKNMQKRWRRTGRKTKKDNHQLLLVHENRTQKVQGLGCLFLLSQRDFGRGKGLLTAFSHVDVIQTYSNPNPLFSDPLFSDDSSGSNSNLKFGQSLWSDRSGATFCGNTNSKFESYPFGLRFLRFGRKNVNLVRKNCFLSQFTKIMYGRQIVGEKFEFFIHLVRFLKSFGSVRKIAENNFLSFLPSLFKTTFVAKNSFGQVDK